MMRCFVNCCVLLIIPTTSAVAASDQPPGPVKVFILAGQSNMEGKALASTLEPVITDAETRDRFKHLKTGDKWSIRQDVWVTFLDRQGNSPFPKYGPLSVGFGGHKVSRDENNKKRPMLSIGPELGIGHVLGDHFDEQVLLIKAAWGGRAVKYSFRPPSAMPDDATVNERLVQVQKKHPDQTFDLLKKSYGSDYRKILAETTVVLSNIKKYFADYDETQGYEIAGFIWFQGWNDGVGRGNPDYTEQMAHFIRDIRGDLETPDLPFVIGELGMDGPEADGWLATFRKQQVAIAAMPEFMDNVRLAKTSHCWHTGPESMQGKWEDFRKTAKANEQKPKDDPTRVKPSEFFQANWVRRYKQELSYTSDRRYHYHGSGRSYYEMGESMGMAMLELVK